MKINSINKYDVLKTAGAILSTTAIITAASCTGKKSDIQNTKETVQTEVRTQNNQLPNYADLAMYFGWEQGKQNLKVENGVSFIADNIKYTAKDGIIEGEMLSVPDSIRAEHKFTVDNRSFSYPAYETIKMVAKYDNTDSSKDTLTLSKNDIEIAKSRLSRGNIWNDVKHYMSREAGNDMYLGQVRNLRPNGIQINLNEMGYKMSETKFYAD